MEKGRSKLSPQEQLANFYDSLADDVLEGHIPEDRKDIERASEVFARVEQMRSAGTPATLERSSGRWADRTGRDGHPATGKLK